MFYKGQLRSMTSYKVYPWFRTGLKMQANIPSHTARLDTHDTSQKQSLVSDDICVFLHPIIHTTILKQIRHVSRISLREWPQLTDAPKLEGPKVPPIKNKKVRGFGPLFFSWGPFTFLFFYFYYLILSFLPLK